MQICFCVLIVQIISTSCQFVDHIDLQKVREVIRNGTVYRLLKATVHKIEDYFKEFIQKRSNNHFPIKRIFIDRDGFRHSWEGMVQLKSLRKSKENIPKRETQEPPKPQTKPNSTVESKKDEKYKPKDGPIRKKKLPDIKSKRKDVYVPVKQIVREGATEIITTFFCPHFGVIKMSSFVDHFDES